MGSMISWFLFFYSVLFLPEITRTKEGAFDSELAVRGCRQCFPFEDAPGFAIGRSYNPTSSGLENEKKVIKSQLWLSLDISLSVGVIFFSEKCDLFIYI